MDYQYGTTYRRVIDSQPWDWCSFMNGTSDNILIKVTVDVIAKTATELIHACPYKGEVKGLNITLDTGKFGGIYPQGKYRTLFRLSDNVDPNIFTISYDYEIKSPFKSSFG